MFKLSILPTIVGENAHDRLTRTLDLLKVEISDTIKTAVLIRDVLMTILQCEARSCERSGLSIENGVTGNLVKSKNFRLLLRLGIQDKLCHLIERKCLQLTSPHTAESKPQGQDTGILILLAQNKAQKEKIKALIIKDIASLCTTFNKSLQGPCHTGGTEELLIFQHYDSIVSGCSIFDKTLLTTLLDNAFEWTPRTDIDGIRVFSQASPKSLALANNIKRHLAALINEGLQQTVTSVRPQLRTLRITECDISEWLGDFCTDERGVKKILRLAGSWLEELIISSDKSYEPIAAPMQVGSETAPRRPNRGAIQPAEIEKHEKFKQLITLPTIPEEE